MAPNIKKFLEDDQDDRMHSKAESNRDFEGQVSTSQQRSLSDAAALTQTENQILSQWQTSSHDEIGHFPSGKNPMLMDQKEQQSSTEKTQHSEEPNPQSDSQMHDLQYMSNQQSMEMRSNNQQPQSEGKGNFPFPIPQIITDLSNPASGGNKGKSCEVENQADSSGMQMRYVKYELPDQSRTTPERPDVFRSMRELQVSSSIGIKKAVDHSYFARHLSLTDEVESREEKSRIVSWMPSLTSPIGPGNSSKALLKKHAVDQKKPMEAPDSSFPSSSKKQKVSAAFMDQSIKNLNDITAISGVNLREEKEHLFPGHTEDSWVSDASRRVVKEDRLILNKIPLERKLAEISAFLAFSCSLTVAKYGLERTSSDVERCLSLRIDIEKPKHITITTSDVKQQIMTKNREAREELERKQAETEKSQKLKEPQSTSQVDGDKDKIENSVRLAKFKKKEVDEMLATATNDAIRAATGVGDMLSRWQLMIEAKPKQGGIGTSNGSQPALVRKAGRKRVIVPQVVRRITIKDVIAVLERDPQKSRSTLIYRLYDKVSDDIVGE
ncbi:hypothetical protein DH2020_004004 [Rehmannia glutinosa]|uniref:Transcription initiation factor TFIID component TAF4 C-terminal domain-containing protein n=1 Tax=Rehmannia glutinosa TaxID=99300 RepID=A0ABR0VYH4_REHGL